MMRTNLVCQEWYPSASVYMALRRLGAAVLVLCSTARLGVAQDPAKGVDAQVVIAALAEIDGWVRERGVPMHDTVTYHFDEGLKEFRPAGGALVRAATGLSNRWVPAVDHRTGCPSEGVAPGCPRLSKEPVVTVGEILQTGRSRSSIHFTLSLPPTDLHKARAVEVRLFRLRKQVDGTFVREGGVELLIP